MNTWEETYKQKAEKWGPWIGKLPGVGCILLSGSVAQGKASKKSDIDIFVIAKPGKIWTSRFFVNLFLILTRQMRRPRDEAGKFCPNHFITTDYLEIRDKDDYSASLFSSARPIYDAGGVYRSFVLANKAWLKNYGYTLNIPTGEKMKKHTSPWSPARIIEWKLKTIQKWKIQRNPSCKFPGAKIILEDTELRFHPTYGMRIRGLLKK